MPEPTTDDYARTTGHEVTCAAGFDDECTCGTSDRTEIGRADGENGGGA